MSTERDAAGLPGRTAGARPQGNAPAPRGAGILRVVIALAVLAAALAVSLAAGTRAAPHPRHGDMLAAARTMLQAEDTVRRAREALGMPIDPELDPNRTGIVGVEMSGITTSAGDIVAKRTATNSDFAALTVRWFDELGLGPGDRIAVGASGSFPGILLAVLSACRATGVVPEVIPSVGASQFGANIPGLTSVEMLAILRREGVFPWVPVAVALGGERDSGRSSFLDIDSLPGLEAIVRASGLPAIIEGDDPGALGRSIAARMAVYGGGAGIRAFVNIGGAEANYGATSASLHFPNGLTRDPVARDPLARAAGPERGLVFEFAERGIPVINYIDLKGLALRNGIAVDPVPLPEPGAGQVYRVSRPARLPAAVGLAIALAILALPRLRNYRARRHQSRS